MKMRSAWTTIFIFRCSLSIKLELMTQPHLAKFPCVVLPGFGNDIVDYISPLNSGVEFGMVSALKRRGIEVEVVPIKRYEWLNIASGIFSKEFWTYDCNAEELFHFYFEKVSQTVIDLNTRTGKPVVLLGHSAGGWLGRGLLSSGSWATHSDLKADDLVLGLCTLGTPHQHPVEQSFDVTRGCLKKINKQYPGAYLNKKNIAYISVAGVVVEGNRTAPWGSPARFAHQSYEQVIGVTDNSGEARYIGDGVVPLLSAHLDGATQINLNSVWHSISAPGLEWYGGENVIDRWLPTVLTKCNEAYTRRAVAGRE